MTTTEHRVAVNLSGEDAESLAEFLDVAGVQGVESTGHTLQFPASALAILADLDAENDGHYDGSHVWVGGREYRVRTI